MTDNIDITVHINTRKEPLINASRMAKGDIDAAVEDGRMTSARVVDDTIIGNLITRGFLGEEHRQAGLDLADLRRCVYGLLSVKTSSMVLMGGMSLSRNKADKLYGKIKKTLSKGTEPIIIHAIDNLYTRDAAAKTIMGIQIYRNCFEELLDVIEKSITELKNEVDHAND